MEKKYSIITPNTTTTCYLYSFSEVLFHVHDNASIYERSEKGDILIGTVTQRTLSNFLLEFIKYTYYTFFKEGHLYYKFGDLDSDGTDYSIIIEEAFDLLEHSILDLSPVEEFSIIKIRELCYPIFSCSRLSYHNGIFKYLSLLMHYNNAIISEEKYEIASLRPYIFDLSLKVTTLQRQDEIIRQGNFIVDYMHSAKHLFYL